MQERWIVGENLQRAVILYQGKDFRARCNPFKTHTFTIGALARRDQRAVDFGVFELP